MEKLQQLFLKSSEKYFKKFNMLFKFFEKTVNFHQIIPIENDFETSPRISIKFGINFLLFYTKLFKITKKFLKILSRSIQIFPKKLYRIRSVSIFKHQQNVSKWRRISFKIFPNFPNVLRIIFYDFVNFS